MPEPSKQVSRRQLLSMIGKVAGGSAMYQAMSSLGYAAESHYNGPVKLGNARPGASVLVLGAAREGAVWQVNLDARELNGYLVCLGDRRRTALIRAAIAVGDELRPLSPCPIPSRLRAAAA